MTNANPVCQMLPIPEFHLQLRTIPPDRRRAGTKRIGGSVAGNLLLKRGHREEQATTIGVAR